MADAMIDCETLATTPNAVVLSVGAVKFNKFKSNEEPHTPLYLRLNVEEQTALGREVNEGTIEWWSKQDPKAMEEAFSEENRVSLEEFTNQLNRYLVGVDKIWAQGPVFDICIFENLYRMLGKPIPWAYYQIRDSRTLFDLGDAADKKGNVDLHNALADAFMQAVSVQQVYKQLGKSE